MKLFQANTKYGEPVYFMESKEAVEEYLSGLDVLWYWVKEIPLPPGYSLVRWHDASELTEAQKGKRLLVKDPNDANAPDAVFFWKPSDVKNTPPYQWMEIPE